MIKKTDPETTKLVQKAEKFLTKIEELKKPNLCFQDDLKKILITLRRHAKKSNTVVYQKIQEVLNEINSISAPSLMIQKISGKEAIELFVKNFK